MQDNLIMLMGIFFAILFMFMFPLIELIGKSDEISQITADLATAEFVNNVATKAEITESEYENLLNKLSTTGNNYNIKIEAKILDSNPNILVTVKSSTLVGDSKYYSVYTDTILEKLDENGTYPLKPNDYIIVTVTSTNITLGTQLRSYLYNTIEKNSFTIESKASALVL